MTQRVLVIGAGVGGLAAAVALAKTGRAVTVLEARDAVGGLAGGFTEACPEPMRFDGGPYILLDRPGLAWAFAALGLSLEETLTLRRIDHVYDVSRGDAPTVRMFASLERTAAEIDSNWPGAGARYARFVEHATRIHRALQPVLTAATPGPLSLLRHGAIRYAPFLLRSFGAVLRHARLPPPVNDALAIWTHIARQSLSDATSPMAFVPALIHGPGAFYPVGGLSRVPEVLHAAALANGASFRLGAKVIRIVAVSGKARAVELENGERLQADAVISDAPGLSTLLELAPNAVSARRRRRLTELPLQSPGVAAYLKLRGSAEPPYLRFWISNDGSPCRLFLRPAVMEPELVKDGWAPARLLSPLGHLDAENMGEDGQQQYLKTIVDETWWRDGVEAFDVVRAMTPRRWGREVHLYRDSMNPTMTARFMRQGRIAHRHPSLRGLYLAGSATHPGQWVSFCAVSGVLAARALQEDASS